MEYTFHTTVKIGFEKAEKKVREALKEKGFGILTEIDVKTTLKNKLNTDFPSYKILGACNPPNAFKALNAEPRIGTMLPCNVIVRELSDGSIEVAAVDPVASMQAVENPALAEIAGNIREKLKSVIESL